MLPERLHTVSVTETYAFRECRRQWYLAYVRGLVPKIPQKHFWFGDILHKGLETYAATSNMGEGIKAFNEAYEASLDTLRAAYGGLWEGAEEMYTEMHVLGQGMLKNYQLFDEANGMTMETVALEQRVWVPIKNATGRAILPKKEEQPRLTARMDRLVKVGDDLYIMDYKSGDEVWTSGKSLEIDDQVTGYNYVYWRLTGELPRGVIYETLLKKLPNAPRILKDGSLSTAKDQNTLHGLYLAAMQTMGLMNSAKHLECLEALRAQEWEGYFSREITSRNIEQVLAYQSNLYFTFRDMRDVVADPRKAYPSPSSMRCPRCPFLTVCISMDDGSDAESMIENQFDVNLEKRW